MSTTKNFPVFEASLEATCFKCGEKLAPRTIAFTHNAPGHGQWVGSCDKCDIRTWFDIQVDVADGGPVDPADYIEFEDRQEVLRSMGRMDDLPEYDLEDRTKRSSDYWLDEFNARLARIDHCIAEIEKVCPQIPSE